MGAGCSDAPGLFLKSSSLLIFLSIERSAAQVSSLAYKLTKAQQLPKTSTHKYTPPNSKTHQLKSSSTQRTINFRTFQLKNFPTQKISNSKAHQLKSTPKIINSPTQNIINSKHHQPKRSSTLKLINLETPQLKNLNYYLLFYNTPLIFTPF